MRCPSARRSLLALSLCACASAVRVAGRNLVLSASATTFPALQNDALLRAARGEKVRTREKGGEHKRAHTMDGREKDGAWGSAPKTPTQREREA